MRIIICLLIGFICAGCNQSSDNDNFNALSQKLDTVLQSQARLSTRLDELPKTISAIGQYYTTNEASFIWLCHTNGVAAILNGMAGQEDGIIDNVNKEVRRVGNGEKALIELKIDQAMMDLQTNFINQNADLKMIKIKLGIPDY